MTCVCIATIEAELPEHKLETAIMWLRAPNTLVVQTFTPLERRDTGRREGRITKPRMVAHKFCPFCGAPYAAETGGISTSQVVESRPDPVSVSSVNEAAGDRAPADADAVSPEMGIDWGEAA